jgi:alpha-galactosidase
VLAVAESFVTLGLRDVGYEYVNIDVCLSPASIVLLYLKNILQDCWALCDRDPETNEQIPDPLKFPHGMKALADRIHSLGLKIGIYR